MGRQTPARGNSHRHPVQHRRLDKADGVVARFAWLAGFDVCIWSHALFMAKPEPAILPQGRREALHATPAHILFLDDRQENIDAAVALGMQTLHYTTQAAFESEMRDRGLTSLLDAGMDARTGGVPAAQMA